MHYIIYFVGLFVFISGLYIMLVADNYLKKIIGLSIFQNSVLIFFIGISKASSGIVPIDICASNPNCEYSYSSPLPHVLMLTAIVVGFATLSVGLAICKKIKETYGTISESEINYRLPKNTK